MKYINLKTGKEESFPARPSVLCIGNFDGVHLGHRQLVCQVKERYEALRAGIPDLSCGAWFFTCAAYKRADDIFTTSEKLEIFASLGLDYAIAADFSEVASLSPEQFVSEILKNKCGCVHAVCGENFRFGAGAAGDSSLLCTLMSGEATVVPLLSVDGETVSSTYIRRLLSEGNIEHANRLLGSNYSVSEPVVHGKALGRAIGFPTINQSANSKKILLKSGIYASICTVDGKKYIGATNWGLRPTVESSGIMNLETTLADYSGDCYGKEVKTEFVARIRDEEKFDNIELLRERIAEDLAAAKKYIDF